MEIQGQRINLRRMVESDAASLQENANHKEIAEFTTLPHPYYLKMGIHFIRRSQRRLKKGSAYELGIELKETGEIIGIMSLMDVDKKNRSAEIGYWLGKKYWRKGIAKEAVQLILKLGFKKLRLVRIWGRVMVPNIGSSKLLEKSGFSPEGTNRKSFLHGKKWMDEHVYSILSEEFKD